MENSFKRLEIDANKTKEEIDAIIQLEFNSINTANGTVTAYDEDFNNDSYSYNVMICYTTP